MPHSWKCKNSLLNNMLNEARFDDFLFHDVLALWSDR
jgi:hypothetical protein